MRLISQRGAWAHRGGGFGVVGAEVAADVLWFALGVDQFLVDGGFTVNQRFGDWGKDRFQFGVVVLGGQGFGPVLRQEEVAAAVVDAAQFTGW